MNEKKSLEIKLAKVESTLSHEQAQKGELESELNAKVRDLDARLAKANQEKDQLYKQQMEKI